MEVQANLTPTTESRGIGVNISCEKCSVERSCKGIGTESSMNGSNESQDDSDVLMISEKDKKKKDIAIQAGMQQIFDDIANEAGPIKRAKLQEIDETLKVIKIQIQDFVPLLKDSEEHPEFFIAKKGSLAASEYTNCLRTSFSINGYGSIVCINDFCNCHASFREAWRFFDHFVKKKIVQYICRKCKKIFYTPANYQEHSKDCKHVRNAASKHVQTPIPINVKSPTRSQDKKKAEDSHPTFTIDTRGKRRSENTTPQRQVKTRRARLQKDK